jgi:Domain of unknown function (DUF4328)
MRIEPLRSRADFALGFLGAIALLDVVATWSDWEMLQYLEGIQRGMEPVEEVANTIDERQAAIGLLQGGLYLVCAVAFSMWMHRAYKALVAARLPGLRFTPAWAAGGFFVPILNLLRPFQVMREIDQAAAWLSGDSGEAREWRAAPRSRRVVVWWALWIATGVVGNIATRGMLRAEELDEIVHATLWTLVSDASGPPAAIAALLVVARITSRIELARSRFDREPPPLPPSSDAAIRSGLHES